MPRSTPTHSGWPARHRQADRTSAGPGRPRAGGCVGTELLTSGLLICTDADLREIQALVDVGRERATFRAPHPLMIRKGWGLYGRFGLDLVRPARRAEAQLAPDEPADRRHVRAIEQVQEALLVAHDPPLDLYECQESCSSGTGNTTPGTASQLLPVSGEEMGLSPFMGFCCTPASRQKQLGRRIRELIPPSHFPTSSASIRGRGDHAIQVGARSPTSRGADPRAARGGGR